MPSGERSKGAPRSKRIPADVDVLEAVIGRIYNAGLILNGRLDGPQLAQRVEAAVGELDTAVRLVRLLAHGARDGPIDLDHLLVDVSTSADDAAVLAGARRDDGPGHFLDQAARHLHRAYMALVEADERS